MKLDDKDLEIVRTRYAARLREYGVTPGALGWDKGKQEIRFDVLTSQYDCKGKSFLDIGCGFGDLIGTLEKKSSSFTYYGVDLVPELIEVARVLHPEGHVRFDVMDFLAGPVSGEFDYAIASGIFNFKLVQGDNYEFVRSAMEKALGLCRDGLAFDFLSDKVDYRYEHTFHYSPERLLGMAYSFSRNVVLRNDYMPFEFSVFIFKDGTFSKEDTLFTRYKELQGKPR